MYTLGVRECSLLEARSALEVGVDSFAVSSVDEGMQLRQSGIVAPILLLSYAAIEELEDLARYNLEPLTGDLEYIALLDKAASTVGLGGSKRLGVHIAVDTGMGRIGCFPEDALKLAQCIQDSQSLKIAGMCTHFSCADSLVAGDIDYTQEQVYKFRTAIDLVRARGIDTGLCHCCNSAGILNLPECHMDMVRLGIAAYGYYPGEITQDYLMQMGKPCLLEPCLALCTSVSVVRPLKEWMSVSYGHEWNATKDTTIAVLPIGYADGLLRSYAKVLRVTIDKEAFPIRGRICMNQCMVEVQAHPIQRYSTALIFGPHRKGAAMDAQDIAQAIHTIPYEVLCNISHSVIREYIEDNTRRGK